MHRALLVTLLVVFMAVFQAYANEAMLAPPVRPAEFRSPQELRDYLKALNEYYAIVGRPRFGKRNGRLDVGDLFRQTDKYASDDSGAAGEYF